LILPFNTGFVEADDLGRAVYALSLGCAAVASALLIGPAAYHRHRFRRLEEETASDKKEMIILQDHLAAGGILFLAYYDSTTRASRFGATITPNLSANEYLHSDGVACTSAQSAGVTTQYFDEVAPTSTSAKCKDSPSINFNGGNPWAVVGTWSRAPQA
jgi:Family of unknown function (DUF6328)